MITSGVLFAFAFGMAALFRKVLIKRVDLFPDIPESSLGSCARCGISWKWVEIHTTTYGTRGWGCFPLCEGCWAGLTPEQRLPYYAGSPCALRDWKELKEAVLQGK